MRHIYRLHEIQALLDSSSSSGIENHSREREEKKREEEAKRRERKKKKKSSRDHCHNRLARAARPTSRRKTKSLILARTLRQPRLPRHPSSYLSVSSVCFCLHPSRF
ncbi:hypothetical protein MAP00_005903 [Monascus purpureus]|nr:hypothetical protein MAP00_005903 [Monascus purpureus]